MIITSKNITVTILIILIFSVRCEKDTTFPDTYYYNELSFEDTSNIHPNNQKYQDLLDSFAKTGAVGISIAIDDQHGTWLGASGYADIKSGIKLTTGNRFFIASTSKVFTAACIYHYIDKGLLSLDDPINKFISNSLIKKVDNASSAKIKHLLSHRSGIRDYYTNKYEMNRINKDYNGWNQEDLLKFIYGKKADFGVDEDYSYSNTNYLLLGMILEDISGKKLRDVYNDVIFTPLNLNSALYDTDINVMMNGTVKGYLELYSNGSYVESDNLYRDELCVGGDGGIAINAQDLCVFMNELENGNIISVESLNKMKDWFDIELSYDSQDKTKNGYGLEYFELKPGIAWGHTGGIDGFGSFMYYFPEKKVTLTILINYDPYSEKQCNPLNTFLDETLYNAIF
jgi:D-alanyl-D-alanine carboxypeptidase